MSRVIIHGIGDVTAEVNFKEEFVWGSNRWMWIGLISGQLQLFCYVLLGSLCPFWETKQEKKIVRCPTVAVRLPWPSLAPVSLQQGAMASLALWFCGEGAGGCPGFRHQLCPVCGCNSAVQLWQRPVADESHLLRLWAVSSPTRRPKLAAPDLQSSQDSLFRTSAISEISLYNV